MALTTSSPHLIEASVCGLSPVDAGACATFVRAIRHSDWRSAVAPLLTMSHKVSTPAFDALVKKYTPEYCARLLDACPEGCEALYQISQGNKILADGTIKPRTHITSRTRKPGAKAAKA